MSALVTETPVTIDVTHRSRTAVEPLNPFLYKVGSALYQVLKYQLLSPSEFGTVGVYKSTNGGQTWVEQDIANHPASSVSGPLGGELHTFLNSSTGIIGVLLDNASGLFIITFNTNTDLWGTAGTNLGTDTDTRSPVIYQISNGTYNVLGLFSAALKQAQYATGAWGSLSVVAGVNQIPDGVAVDSSDRGHVIYSPSSPGTLSYIQISPTFTPGTPIVIDAGVEGALAGGSVIKLWNNKIAIAAVIPGSPTWTIRVYIGGPIAAPVFTTYNISTTTAPGFFDYITLGIDDDGKLSVFWVVYDYSTNPVVDELQMSTFDGVSTWSAPILFYDEVTNPPPSGVTDPLAQNIHTADVVMLNGSWIFSTAMETESPTACTGFVLISPGDIPPTPACPVSPGGNGTVGIPFTATLTASGGTPPYTFTITGGTLPPGLTLDSTTGIISGTPTTAGTYPYTVQVTGS